MDRIKLYIKESYNELINKVTWPSWKELQANTMVVIIAIAIFVVVVFLMDSASSLIVNTIYKLS